MCKTGQISFDNLIIALTPQYAHPRLDAVSHIIFRVYQSKNSSMFLSLFGVGTSYISIHNTYGFFLLGYLFVRFILFFTAVAVAVRLFVTHGLIKFILRLIFHRFVFHLCQVYKCVMNIFTYRLHFVSFRAFFTSGLMYECVHMHFSVSNFIDSIAVSGFEYNFFSGER